jgi:hypothetical protein
VTGRQFISGLGVAVVVAIVLAVALGGQRGDEALAIAWMAIGVLCLPAMIAFLVHGGRRRRRATAAGPSGASAGASPGPDPFIERMRLEGYEWEPRQQRFVPVPRGPAAGRAVLSREEALERLVAYVDAGDELA